MRLALGVLLIWIGCALIWVAFHGLDGETATPGAIINTLGSKLRQETSVGPGGAAEGAGIRG